MDIDQARKILGPTSKNIPDEVLQKEIDTARLLANIFFDIISKKGIDCLRPGRSKIS